MLPTDLVIYDVLKIVVLNFNLAEKNEVFVFIKERNKEDFL